MNIAILGTGHIGSTLGKKWADAGHKIFFGTRDTNKPEVKDLLAAVGASASAHSVADAIKAADVVLFAIPGKVMDEAIQANAAALNGKIIIDAANKIGSTPMNSLATFAAHAPDAKLYRAFNIYGWENFETPTFGSTSADLFYAGHEGDSQGVVEGLISAVGINPVYVGGVDQADAVDGLLKLWFALYAGQKKGRHLAFKMLV